MDRRRLLTIGLFLLTVALAAVAIFIGISVQQSQAPGSAFAASDNCCQGTDCENYGGNWDAGWQACAACQCACDNCPAGPGGTPSQCTNGDTRCNSGTSQVCNNGFWGDGGSACGGTTPPPTGTFKCPTTAQVPGTAGSCKDLPPGTIIGYSGGTCKCTKVNNACSCVPTAGSICEAPAGTTINGNITDAVCSGKGVGTTCNNTGTCASIGTDSNKVGCKCTVETSTTPPTDPGNAGTTCANQSDCNTGLYCNLTASQCYNKHENNWPSCSAGYQCLSGYCETTVGSPTGTCKAVGTAPAPGQGGDPVGGNCIDPANSSTFKSAGDLCVPSCGYNACDGGGILNCKTCVSPVSLLDSNQQLAKEGQTVCMHPTSGTQQTAACGGVVPIAAGAGGGSLIGGDPTSCISGSWNVYRCLSCSETYQQNGCQQSTLAVNVDYATAKAYLEATPSCQITQIDCIGSTGSSLVFQSQLNCAGDCDTSPVVPGQEPGTPGGPSPSEPGSETSSSESSPSQPSSSSSSSSTPPSSSSSSSGSVTEACVYLEQTSPASGTSFPPGQDFVYTAQFTCLGLNDDLTLVVLDGSNPVGTPTNIDPSSSVYNAGANTCTYTFQWSSTGVTDGNYQVRLRNTGAAGSEISTPVACTESLQLQSSAPSQEAIVVSKTAGVLCEEDANGGARIDYTVTVSNIGDVTALITTVRDNLPAGVNGADSSKVTNVIPTTGLTRTGTYLEWAVNNTLAVGANMTFTYSINFTETELAAVNNGTLTNNVVVTYGDEGSTYEFDNAVDVEQCLEGGTAGGGSLPATGLFDEGNGPLLLGLILILLGIVANRYSQILQLLGFEAPSRNISQELGDSISSKALSLKDKVLDSLVGRSEEGFKRGVLRRQKDRQKKTRE